MVMLGLSTERAGGGAVSAGARPPPLPGLRPYSSAELRGREVYIANGCVYCHTQQPARTGLWA